jgi:hypothetical protein
MQWQIQQALQKSLEARAKNVPREGILDEIGPLFDEEFRLDDEEDETREEIKTSLLERTAMPSGVVVERIWLGSTEYEKGTVDIEVSPMGLYETVLIHVRGEDDDYYTVTWDPITGGAHLVRGKEMPR